MPDEFLPAPVLSDQSTNGWKFTLGSAKVMARYLGGMLSFEGRISRAGFWNRILLLFLVFVLAIVVAFLVQLPFQLLGHQGSLASVEDALGIVAILVAIPFYILAMWFILATRARRWHDLNASGWMILWGIIPLVGLVLLIIEGCVKGTLGPNKYGVDRCELRANFWESVR